MVRIKLLVPASIILSITFILISSSLATTYYFSQSGSDATGNGTQANPWKSISKANSTIAGLSGGPHSILFKRGDTWLFGSGEFLQITKGGTGESAELTIGDYGTGTLPILNGQNHNNYRGLIFVGNYATGANISYVTIQNLDVYNSPNGCIGSYAESPYGVVSYITIRGCKIHVTHNGFSGIEVMNQGSQGASIHHWTVDNNEIYNSSHNGIRFFYGATYITITNNIVHDHPHHGIDGWWESGHAQNAYWTVSGNDVYNVNGGIYLADADYITIDGNDIHDGAAIEGPDTFGIMMTSTNSTVHQGNIIQRNRIWDLDAASSLSYAIWVSRQNNIKVYNNTIYSNYKTMLRENCTNYDIQNNLAYANTIGSSPSADMQNFGSNPLFVNPTSTPPDLHLQADSPAIDIGVDVGLPYHGQAPDLGAYEYGFDSAPNPPTGLTILFS
jgi:parallel beta-helix repeat protein